MIKHINIKVFGRVQGVFFRQSARIKARELNLVGLAKNLPDGSVYLEAEGREADLKILLDWCRRGPVFAKVEKVEEEISDKLKYFKEFTVD